MVTLLPWPTYVAAQSAASYPEKPVRVISALATGGAVDTVGRIVATKLSENLRRQFIVENRLGGGGTIGYAYTAKAPPDGYTLLVAGSGYTIAPALYPIPFDPIKDIIPLSQTSTSAYLLVVHPSLPTKSTRELVVLAKAQPGVLNFGSGGVGSSVHFATEMLAEAAGVKFTHIAYKGSGQALIDLVSGQLQLVMSNSISSLPLVKSGRLRVLGVSSAQRSVSFPEIPTIAESGVPGFKLSVWTGLFGPGGMPADIVAKLNTEIAKALKDPEIARKMTDDGGEPIESLEQFRQTIRSELEINRKIAQRANIKVE
jgi:tripartite-type tricarboxylate transporter receptor subunit TctC